MHEGEGSFHWEHYDTSKIGVECEIAVELSAPLGSANGGDTPHTIESVAQSVGRMMPAIEIVCDRYEDFTAAVPGFRTWIADDFFGAGAVLGCSAESLAAGSSGVGDVEELLKADQFTGTMVINGEGVGSGVGADIIGHPLEALAWLANHHTARGVTMPQGWVVLLGSVVQTQWVSQGDVVEVQLHNDSSSAGIGQARATFV